MSDEVETNILYLGQPNQEDSFDRLKHLHFYYQSRIKTLELAIVQYAVTVWEREGVTFIDDMKDEGLKKALVELLNPYFALGEKE